MNKCYYVMLFHALQNTMTFNTSKYKNHKATFITQRS